MAAEQVDLSHLNVCFEIYSDCHSVFLLLQPLGTVCRNSDAHDLIAVIPFGKTRYLCGVFLNDDNSEWSLV